MSDHTKIEPATGTWVIRAAGAVLGESNNALKVVEGDKPFVIYFPRADISMAFFDKSETSTICPHKGTATYYNLIAKSGTYKDTTWSYEAPKDDFTQIKDYVAFFVDNVVVEQL
ncbi:MAG: DUF427 domain-containing protein [Octadecabacter sp.]|nr:DUF427 domain-containing protein [Octadecabacter sp.]